MDTRKLKDRAAQALAKGKVDKAVELYEELVRADPRDLQLKVRLGDVYRRAGNSEKAIALYRAVVDRYARDGLLLKAIAVCKIVLEVDPEHSDTQELLAGLYARKYGKGGGARNEALAAVPIPLTQTASPDDGIDLGEEELPASAPFEVEVHERSRSSPRAVEEEPAVGERGNTMAPPLEVELGTGDEEGEELVIEGEEVDLDAALAEATASLEASEESPGEDVAPAPPPEPEIELELEEEPPSHEPAVDPDHLPQIPLFSELGKAAFIGLLETCVLMRKVAGEEIVAQGEPGDAFYVIVSGEVLVVRRDDAGNETELATLGEGAFFGELSLLSDAPRLATVTAKGEVELLAFGKKALDKLIREHPSVDGVLHKFARQRLLANVMATSPLFRPFDRGERRLLIEKFKSREVERGEAVLTEGEAVDGLYVILAGAVSVTRQQNTRKVNLASLKEGDLFGEISLLTRQKATATVTARRKGTVLRLPRKVFEEVILTHPQILELVAELTEERQQKNEAILAGRLAYDEEGMVLV